MKKLFLLPLFAALALTGCNIGGKDSGGGGSEPGGDVDPEGGGGGGGGASGGGSVSDKEVVLDFTSSYWSDNKVTPYISNTEMGALKDFSYGGTTYNDVGCYASKGYNGGTNYLMMKNTKYGEAKDQFAEDPAYISNRTAFAKAIKKVKVEVEGESSSGNTIYRVNIGTSEYTAAVTEGGQTGKKGQTIELVSNDANAHYFAVSTNKTAEGKIYNGQLLKVTISFE